MLCCMTKLTLTIILLLASCTQKSEAWQGREGESCRPDGSCDGQLICDEGTCSTMRKAIEMLKKDQNEIRRMLRELGDAGPAVKPRH